MIIGVGMIGVWGLHVLKGFENILAAASSSSALHYTWVTIGEQMVVCSVHMESGGTPRLSATR